MKFLGVGNLFRGGGSLTFPYLACHTALAYLTTRLSSSSGWWINSVILSWRILIDLMSEVQVRGLIVGDLDADLDSYSQADVIRKEKASR